VTPVPDESAIDASVFTDFRAIGAGDAGSDFVTKIIDQYLEEATSQVAVLKNAVERGDAPALRLATHGLRGTSGTVGANRMAAICADLEKLARGTSLDGAPTVVAALEDEFTRVRDALHLERGRAA
jgi:HPt (histidine-containing phosphotransfer) domain-containing protein